MYEDFYEKMGIADASKLVRGIAFQMLCVAVRNNQDVLEGRPEVADIYMPIDLAQDEALVLLIEGAGMSGVLPDVLERACAQEDISTPLLKDGYEAVYHYLSL